MSRIPSLAKYAAPNTYTPRWTWATDAYVPGNVGLWSSSSAPSTSISTIRTNQVNRKTITLYFEIIDTTSSFPSLFYAINSSNNYTVDVYDFFEIQDGDSITIDYGNLLSLAPVGRADDDGYRTVKIRHNNFSGNIIQTINIWDAAI
jgi:hypothetical protein